MSVRVFNGSTSAVGLNSFYSWLTTPSNVSGTFLENATFELTDGSLWDNLTITLNGSTFTLKTMSDSSRSTVDEWIAYIEPFDSGKALRYTPRSSSNGKHISLQNAYLCKYGIIFKMYYVIRLTDGGILYDAARTTAVLSVDESGSLVFGYISPCPGTHTGSGDETPPDSFYACAKDSIATYYKPTVNSQQVFTNIHEIAVSKSDGTAIIAPHLFVADASQCPTTNYSDVYSIYLDGTVYITNGVWYIEDEKVNRGGGGGGGTSDYTELDNKPQINSVTLSGNKSASDLGLAAASDLTNKADKATTLAGYGITDAKIVSGTITLGNQSITPLTQHQDLSGIEDALAAVIDGGAKNLIPFDLEAMKAGNSSAGYTWSDNVCTISDGSSLNIVITVGADGVITATGSKPATSSGLNFRIVPAAEAYDLPLGDYVLSGCPAGGSSATYQLRALINNSSVFAQDTGAGASFTTTAATMERIEIAFGTSAISNMNLTFRPMISAKALYDASDKYVPYVPSMQELYQRILALES